MHCLFFLFASLLVCQASETEPIDRIIQEYFNSASVERFRRQWENHRKPMEHAIMKTLKETIGLTGMNVYIRKSKDKLATGYYHNDNQVRLILMNLNLDDLPHCRMPEVQFSLASNVLKIQTTLSKMIIHADYALIRNKSDIFHDTRDQDPMKSSPFLFEQVQDVGKVAITIDGCMLSGFIMTMLKEESVYLGYDHLEFLNCQYNIEIYRPGEDSPPVIARYNPYREGEQGLDLTHLIMKPFLNEELVPKLQSTLFSFVNTSAIFDQALLEYRENQEIVFQLTAQYLTELVRNLNRITMEKNNGAVEMEDFIVHWDDGRVKTSNTNPKSQGETVKFMDMVLTGLDTMYSAHIGGPFKMNSITIAEEIRFSSLQVRGKLEIKSKWSDSFSFAAEISDMAVDLHMGQSQGDKENGKQQNKSKGFKKLEVKGFRNMVFTVPSLIFGSAESMVGGYLIAEVPKLIKSHLRAIFPEALQSKSKASVSDTATHAGSGTDNKDSQDETQQEEEVVDSEDDLEDEKLKLKYSDDFEGKRERDIFKKSKKRFKSVNRPWRRHGNHKRVAANQIKKK